MTDRARPILSPSQIQTYRLCARKWGFQYLDGIRAPSTGAQDLGTRVHKVLEAWLEEGKMPDPKSHEGAIARAGLKYLPPPRTPGMAIEEEFLLYTPAATFTGLADVFQADGGEGRPRIIDHKTTSSFDWIKTSEDLLTDAQAVIYAAHAREVTGADEVDLRWVYYKTKGWTGAKAVDARIDLTTIDRSFTRILDDAAEMVSAHAAGLNARDMPPNLKACEAFGGCPHRERCGITATERMVALMAQESLKEKLAKMKGKEPAAGGTTGNGAAINPPEAAKPPPTEPEKKAEGKKAAPAKQMTLAEKLAAKEGVKEGTRTDDVRPPPHPAHVIDLDENGKPIAVEPTREEKGKALASAVSKESKTAKAKAAETATPPAPSEKGEGFLVLVDCVPSKGGMVPVALADLLAPVYKELHQAEKVAHWKLIEYGKGPGLLAVALDKHLEANPAVKAGVAVSVDSRTAEYGAVIDVLTKHATVVLRGV